jgi:phosphatidylinositol 3,5-bisphosphate 5-phosphatase
VTVLNLIKQHDGREQKLGVDYEICVEYLNQFLPKEKRMDYIPWDMSKAYKE